MTIWASILTAFSAFSIKHFSQNWLSNPRADILSGLSVALTLISEAIAFSIIAGVSPQVGLYASFCIAIVIAFFGGRPAMISAATGAMALVLASLVKHHGITEFAGPDIAWAIAITVLGFTSDTLESLANDCTKNTLKDSRQSKSQLYGKSVVSNNIK